MDNVTWAFGGGVALIALVGWLIWISIRTLADAIIALSVFIAVFTLEGDELSDVGESILARPGMLPAGTTRMTVMIAGDAVAVAVTIGISCLAVLAARLVLPRGPQAGG